MKCLQCGKDVELDMYLSVETAVYVCEDGHRTGILNEEAA